MSVGKTYGCSQCNFKGDAEGLKKHWPSCLSQQPGYLPPDETIPGRTWLSSPLDRDINGNNGNPLPWDSRVTRDNNFATEVWKVCDEIGNLLITKQADYGPGNINNAHGGAINGLLVRIGDKFERLKNLFSNKTTPNHESIEDSFKDLANYAIIALMVERGTWPKS